MLSCVNVATARSSASLHVFLVATTSQPFLSTGPKRGRVKGRAMRARWNFSLNSCPHTTSSTNGSTGRGTCLRVYICSVWQRLRRPSTAYSDLAAPSCRQAHLARVGSSTSRLKALEGDECTQALLVVDFVACSMYDKLVQGQTDPRLGPHTELCCFCFVNFTSVNRRQWQPWRNYRPPA